MRRLFGILLLALLPMTACSDDDGSGPNATIEGAYTMQTINGAGMPYVVAEGPGFKYEFLSSILTIQQGGTFSEVLTTRVTDPDGVVTESETSTGTWVRVGNNVTLTYSAEEQVAGVWNGSNQLTFTQSDPQIGTFVFVFRK